MSKKQLTEQQIAEKAEKKALRAKKNYKNLMIFLELVVIATCIYCFFTTVSINSDISKTEFINTDNTNNSVAVNSEVQQNTGNNNAVSVTPSVEAENQDDAFKTPEEIFPLLTVL